MLCSPATSSIAAIISCQTLEGMAQSVLQTMVQWQAAARSARLSSLKCCVNEQVFRLSFGPKSFVVVSDAEVARYILMTNAGNYTKGVLSEILDFVMGKGEEQIYVLWKSQLADTSAY